MTFIKHVHNVDNCEYLLFSCENMANKVWEMMNDFGIFPKAIVCFDGYYNAIQL